MSVVSPFEKPSISAGFDGADWIAAVTVWVTGETEVETVRKGDGRVINTHYDLENIVDLDIVLDELRALVGDGAIPPRAFLAWL